MSVWDHLLQSKLLRWRHRTQQLWETCCSFHQLFRRVGPPKIAKKNLEGLSDNCVSWYPLKYRSFKSGVKVCLPVWPRLDLCQVEREVDRTQLVVHKLPNVPRQIVVPRNTHIYICMHVSCTYRVRRYVIYNDACILCMCNVHCTMYILICIFICLQYLLLCLNLCITYLH